MEFTEKNKPLIQLPEITGATLVFFTTIVMAFSSLFNVIPILIFLGLWLPLPFYKRQFVLNNPIEVLFILSLPFLCCLSTLWSDKPTLTLYHGLQFGSMIVCTLICARLVTTTALIKGLSLGVLCVLLITLAGQNYQSDHFSGGSVLVGYFGSKNIVGFFATIGILSGLLTLFLPAPIWQKFIFGLPALCISLGCLILSQSASSFIAAFCIAGALLVAGALDKLPLSYKWLAAAMICFAGLVLLISTYAFEINYVENILSILNRNPTLTGRTFLWEQGIEQLAHSPILGHGYRAFWVPGNNLAEYLWDYFAITGKSGFHFHNFFIQIAIDLGALGLVLGSALLIITVFKTLLLPLRFGMTLETTLLLGLGVMFAIRTMVEVDLLGPYGMGSFLFYMLLPRALDYERRNRRRINSE